MKVLEKHYHYFFSLYFPVLLMVVAIMLCAIGKVPQALWAQATLCAFAVIAIFVKGGQTTPKGIDNTLSLNQTLAYTMLFQTALFLHFYLCTRLMLHWLPVEIHHPDSWPHAHTLMKRWFLFPWPFYACTSIAIAKACYVPGKQGFLSDATAPLIGNKPSDSISQFINHTVRSYTLAIVVLCVVFCLLFLVWAHVHFNIPLKLGYNAPAFLFSSLAMLPFAIKPVIRWMDRVIHLGAPMMFTLTVCLILYATYLSMVSYVIPVLLEGHRAIVNFPSFTIPGSERSHWLLFISFVMCAWTPIAGGVMAYLWRDYPTRWVLLAQMIMPVILVMLFQHVPIRESVGTDCLLSFISFGVIGAMLFRKKPVVSFIRTQVYGIEQKYRNPGFLTKSLLLATSLFCSIYILTGFAVFSFILLICVIFCIYFCSYAILALFRK